MFNADPSLCNISTLTTDQIQKYLEENKELILAILKYQNLGKFSEISQCQAKLQHNLTFLAKLADAGCQAQTPPQVSSQAIIQQPQVALSQPQPDPSTMNLPLEMNDQQLQQQQLVMSLHQPGISTSKLPLQMNEQNYKMPLLLNQQEVIPGPMASFPGITSGVYQASQTRFGNPSDTPSSNQTGSDSGPSWS